MFSSLLARFLVATRVATGITLASLVIMAINAVDAIYGKKIRRYLSPPGEKLQKHGKKKP